MKSKNKNSFNLFSLFFVFIILNSNCLVLLNAVKAHKFAMNSTAEVESDHHEHHDNHRLRKNTQLKALMKASSSSRKKISSKEIQLNPTSKSKKRLHHKAHRLAKTHIDPVTAAIIVKYTAAVITKILDYGTAKVKEFTKAVYQKTLNQIDSSKNQWRIMLETQCFFFRMIRQITKVYLMSSDYEHYMLTRSGKI